MALTTYAELKDSISNWLKRSDLSAYLDDLITLAETRIFRDVKNQGIYATYSEAISNGTTTVPSGFLGWRDVRIVSGSYKWPLTVATPNQTLQSLDYPAHTRAPKYISNDGSTFSYYPYPDGEYTVEGTYYKKPSPLSTAVYSLFTNNPDLFLFGALAEAAPFLKDDKRVELWEAKYRQIVNDVNRQYERTRFSGPLAMTARGA